MGGAGYIDPLLASSSRLLYKSKDIYTYAVVSILWVLHHLSTHFTLNSALCVTTDLI